MADQMEITRIPYSKIEYESVCVIKNFRDLDDKVGNFRTSPKFYSQNGSKDEWVLDIYPNGNDDKHSKFVVIRFYLANESEVDLDELAGLRFVTSIVDEGGKKYSIKSSRLEKDWPFSTTFEEFVLREDLLNKPKLLPNGELRIAFKISFDESNISDQTSICHESLSKILNKVFDAGNYTDFKFIVEDQEFNVHRAILAARSPVFEAMFASQMRESKEGKVEITDIEASVMEKLLRFVYVGKVEDFEDLAGKILIAAEKYQIDELKQLCENVLFDQLSLTNVYETLCLADANSAENLKTKTIEFFYRSSKDLTADSNCKVHLNSLSEHLKTDIIYVLMNKH